MKLLKFQTPDCHACDAMEGTLDAAKAKFSDVAFETHCVTEEPALAARFRIRGAPTFIALDDDDNVLSVRVGIVPRNDFISWVEEML